MAYDRPSSRIADGEPSNPSPPASRRRDDSPPEPLDPAHGAAVRAGLDEMRRGELASDEDMAIIYRRAGL